MKKTLTMLVCLILFGTSLPTFANTTESNLTEGSFKTEGNITYETFELDGKKYSLTREIYQNGKVSSVLTEDGVETLIEYNPDTHETFVNGSKVNNGINEIEDIGIGARNYATSYVGSVTYNIPVGTAMGVAISMVAAYTKLPVSMVKQMLLIGGIALGALAIDEVLNVKVATYKTTKKFQDHGMCFPQYKFQYFSNLIINGKKKAGKWSDFWLASKPC